MVSKNGDTIAASVTNLDFHDIARAAKTYSVRAFYVVTPLSDQRLLVERLVSHWKEGIGASYNPKRHEALNLISIMASFEDVLAHIETREGGSPTTVVTTAKHHPRNLSYGGFRDMLKSGRPYLLLFGTAWGLTEKFISGVDYVLDPIEGNGEYNHLSVRSAASIILDRVLGDQK